jgi:membrane associated rhomboid family serine protease
MMRQGRIEALRCTQGTGMGIHDRDYYRDGDDGFLARLMRQGQMCKTLVIINVIAFVIQLVTMPHGVGRHSGDGWFTDAFILSPDKVLHGEIWRLWTHGFLHSPDTPWHIIFNMLLLWWFGEELENHYGGKEFLAFYLLALPIAGLAYVGAAALGLNGASLETKALGASGAVMAVLVVYAFHYPNTRVWLFYLIPIPIWLLVVIYVGKDVWGMLTPHYDGERVGFAAHVGGAAFGFIYYWRDWRILSWIPSWPARTVARSQPKLRVYRERDDGPVNVPSAPARAAKPVPDDSVDEHLEAQVDELLAKVAKHGKDSLTPAENDILQKAGELYRKRRR